MTVPTAQPLKGTNHRQAPRADLLGYVEHLASQGDFLRIPVPLQKLYFVNSPALIEQILLRQSQSIQKPAFLKFAAKGIFGENLFTSDGELWRTLRSTIQPIFNAKRLEAYAEIAAGLTQETLDTWESGQTINLSQAMMDLTLGITTTCFFGLDLRQRTDGRNIVRFIELFNQRLTGVPIPAWIPTPQNRELKYLVKGFNRLFDQLIAERRPQAEQYDDILSLLLLAQRQDQTGLLSDRQIANEVSNLFAAGYELIGYTLTFTLYLLSQHPEIEDHLMAELDRVLGDRLPTLADLEAMPYLEAVLKESMRLLPGPAVLLKQTSNAITLGGNSIEKGAILMIAPWTLHRRSDIYPEPLNFDPDRFMGHRAAEISKFAYLPFSEGPRICIGRLFAMMQMRINLAMLLQQFKCQLDSDFELKPVFKFNLRPQEDLYVRLEQRQYQEAGLH
jgi:cytochrome P450